MSGSVPEDDPNNGDVSLMYPTLDYINRILLEEDTDEQIVGYQEVTALADIEKPFYDILVEKGQLDLGQSNSNRDAIPPISNNPVIPSLMISARSSQDSRVESSLAIDFMRGMEEGKMFLPTINNLPADLHVSRLSLDTMPKHKDKLSEYELHEKNAHGLDRHKSKKNSTTADPNILECRNCKIPMHFTEETIRDELFDKVLLNYGDEYASEEAPRKHDIKKSEASPQFNKKRYVEDSVDLELLLIQCSEAVAHNNRKIAEELIKDLKKHASPVGTGAQRLACIVTDGLEARLAGTGSETYRRLINSLSTREMLKAYHMYITASPFLRISYYFANEYICKVAENASKIHVVDLGITFGFQWPPLIQALARRKGGAPKLRITGIDLPQPGFRPAERIKQIGVRLGEYAKSFGIHLEYQYIASLFECIHIEDLKINDDEVLIVNNKFRFKEIRDETFSTDSPRNRVLNLIKQIKPKIFIFGEYSVHFSPLFIRRFRMVLLHYSMLFNMFDTLTPRDDIGRQLMEREVLGPLLFNAVACEGPDWVERPETYKQWHRRISQAGFQQIPLDRNIVRGCTDKVKSCYHEGFFIEEDRGWLLQGWKGRINYGLSVWEPKV